MELPPLRYWRARTDRDFKEADRSGLLVALVLAPVLIVVLIGVGSVLSDPPSWLITVVTLVVVAPFGFWGELRAARKRQERDSRTE
jgi:hypothetical protein